MLLRAGFRAVGPLQRQLGPAIAVRGLATTTDQTQEGLADKIKHAAEGAVHKAEDVVHAVEHKVEDAVHRAQHYVAEKREHAREEAERGMFTADDIREAAAQMAAARGGTQSIIENAVKTEEWLGQEAGKSERRHERHPDSDEELLEESTRDWGSPAREREMREARKLVDEEIRKE